MHRSVGHDRHLSKCTTSSPHGGGDIHDFSWDAHRLHIVVPDHIHHAVDMGGRVPFLG